MTTAHPCVEVFYDADCRMCVGAARTIERALTRRQVALRPLQSPGAAELLGVADGAVLDEMRARLEDGTVVGGADALVEIARRIWWASPLWALSRLPGAMPALRAAYRWIARRRGCAGGACSRRSTPRWPGFAPFAALPLAFVFRSSLPPWLFMWTVAFTIFACCKWLTYWDALRHGANDDPRRAIAYLLAWPGMDAAAFLADDAAVQPCAREWLVATAKILLGAALFSFAAHRAAVVPSILVAWLGMLAIVLMLHFGSFELLSLAWRRGGVRAAPLMDHPLRSTSLSELWGRRWNTAFHALVERTVFRPLRSMVASR